MVSSSAIDRFGVLAISLRANSSSNALWVDGFLDSFSSNASAWLRNAVSFGRSPATRKDVAIQA
jgi:hypothetical protein